jgi:hypothetical protein
MPPLLTETAVKADGIDRAAKKKAERADIADTFSALAQRNYILDIPWLREALSQRKRVR